MDVEIAEVPAGNGQHPITLVVLSAGNLSASAAFYSQVFGWRMEPVSAVLTIAAAPAGPAVSLRSDIPDGFPGTVPFITVADVHAALKKVAEAGGSVDHDTWHMPATGRLARFKDPSGTIYGLTGAVQPGRLPRLPSPLGAGPKPPAGTVCSLEMYAADGAATARFFTTLFGWGSGETMPQFMGFDPGAGIGGVFQSHTPSLPAVAYIYAIDVGATLQAVDAAGGSRTGDAMSMPGVGCFGYFKDPSGTAVGLIGPA
jgi:predicted enzyme related to lactoylglutathione lyase